MDSSRLFNLLLLLLCFAGAVAVAAEAGSTRRPGFLFSRTRGRCTAQFWSSGREAWPRMAPESATVAKIFGSRAHERYGSEMTLMEAAAATVAAADEEEEAFGRVVKEATVALLNSYARRREFPYSAWEVKTLFIKALVSKEAAVLQSRRFAFANESCN
ncbi:uncharacterized protein LOC120086555 [Benincasa hispida]|uniref:uncharacterized protein LOC120086555 n=1 Tax=Benincasa hispida TaxID=102211 RepID=UPI0018FF8FCD|nr:uncharacterized protein LOC120086555 [Benincasa hispida]